jgi:hypothetical protein
MVACAFQLGLFVYFASTGEDAARTLAPLLLSLTWAAAIWVEQLAHDPGEG